MGYFLNATSCIDKKYIERLNDVASQFGESVLNKDIEFALNRHTLNKAIDVNREIVYRVGNRIVNNLCTLLGVDFNDFNLEIRNGNMVIYYKFTQVYSNRDVELLK